MRKRCSSPRLSQVGCAGKIVSFRETDDNRYLITLAGHLPLPPDRRDADHHALARRLLRLRAPLPATWRSRGTRTFPASACWRR